MRVLVWQWGRRGAGPRFAGELARSFAQVAGTESLLSLSEGAEVLQAPNPPRCDLKMRTYTGQASFALRALSAPVLVPGLARWAREREIAVALCAMPAAMDFVMAAALRRAGVPYAVVVHDADLHPGDNYPFQIRLQQQLVGGASGVFALSTHVASRLREQGVLNGRKLLTASLPPFDYGPPPPPVCAHGGKLRLLSFGRLLPYKGLDLLADGLALLGARDDLEVRVVGSGPESPVLQRLRALPGVTVERRWVPEAEVAGLLAWSDALVLSHREASQSGVAAIAMAGRRWLVATRVGGLEEQLGREPMAILCEPTAASLADALRCLLTAARRPPPAAPDLHGAWREVAANMVGSLARLCRDRVPAPAE